jgi:hypothetical protein
MQLNRSVLFVGDGGNPPILKRLLNDRQIELHAKVKPASVKLSVLSRHLQYLRLAAFAVFSRKKFDAIFIWQQYVGLYYFLISIVYPFYPRPCCVYYIIFQAKPRSLVSWAKRFMMTSMIHSRFVQKAIFLSHCDALYPDISEEKRELRSTYTEKSSYIEGRLTEGFIPIDSDYFSGGVNNRDYPFLRLLAESMGDKKFNVACLPKDMARMSPIPQNVHVNCNAYGDAFEELILSTKAVVLPIEDPNVTSGQIVCLRALQAAKPVFITRNNFILDWMPDFASLRFLVMYDELDELRSLLNGFKDSDLQQLGSEARDYFLKHFDEESFYRGIADIIEAELNRRQ